MPKKSQWPPVIRRDGPYDRVWIPAKGGRPGYWYRLGRTGSDEARASYRRLVLEVPDPAVADARKQLEPPTIDDLCTRFLAHYESLKRSDGMRDRVRRTISGWLELYGTVEAGEFRGPQLKAMQRAWAERGLGQAYIREQVSIIRQVYRQAASDDVIPVEWYHSLLAVPGLEAGQHGCKPPRIVEPVSVAQVEATIPHVRPTVAAMIRVQLLTGMRPGELCSLSPGEIHRGGVVRVVGRGSVDVSKLGGVWVYAPGEHKTERLGYGRYVAVGPLAQAVLLPFLDRKPDAPCFSPRADYEALLAERAASRKTPLWPSHQKRREQAAERGRELHQRERYDTHSYSRAITRACKAHGIAHWHPHQLRHAAEMVAEINFDLDAARAMLGHRDPRVTARYGVRDVIRAAEVAAKIG